MDGSRDLWLVDLGSLGCWDESKCMHYVCFVIVVCCYMMDSMISPVTLVGEVKERIELGYFGVLFHDMLIWESSQ